MPQFWVTVDLGIREESGKVYKMDQKGQGKVREFEKIDQSQEKARKFCLTNFVEDLAENSTLAYPI